MMRDIWICDSYSANKLDRIFYVMFTTLKCLKCWTTLFNSSFLCHSFVVHFKIRGCLS